MRPPATWWPWAGCGRCSGTVWQGSVPCWAASSSTPCSGMASSRGNTTTRCPWWSACWRQGPSGITAPPCCWPRPSRCSGAAGRAWALCWRAVPWSAVCCISTCWVWRTGCRRPPRSRPWRSGLPTTPTRSRRRRTRTCWSRSGPSIKRWLPTNPMFGRWRPADLPPGLRMRPPTRHTPA